MVMPACVGLRGLSFDFWISTTVIFRAVIVLGSVRLEFSSPYLAQTGLGIVADVEVGIGATLRPPWLNTPKTQFQRHWGDAEASMA